MDGDADDASVTARISSGWFKFRLLVSFFTAKDVSLLLRVKVKRKNELACIEQK